MSPARTGLGAPGTGSSLRSFPLTSQGHLDLQEGVGISTSCREQSLERAAGKCGIKSVSCCQRFVASVLFCPVSIIINVDVARSKAAGLLAAPLPCSPGISWPWDICPRRCRENKLQVPAPLNRTDVHPVMNSFDGCRALLQEELLELCSPRSPTPARGPAASPGSWAADFSNPGEEPNHSKTRPVNHSQGFVGVFDSWSGFNYEPTLQ